MLAVPSSNLNRTGEPPPCQAPVGQAPSGRAKLGVVLGHDLLYIL